MEKESVTRDPLPLFHSCWKLRPGRPELTLAGLVEGRVGV